MRITSTRLQITAVGILAFATVLLVPAGWGTNYSVAGSYLCESVNSKACSNTPLQLTADGAWRWGIHVGNYVIRGRRIQFSGAYGGPGTWGWATIGPGTLNFNQYGDNAIWRKLNPASQQLSGVYHCQTAPYGCMTSRPLEVRPEGTWAVGGQSGQYSVVNGQARFRGGLTGGPTSWGPASIGNGSLTFHSTKGDSVWVTGGAAPVINHTVGFVGDPRQFDLSGFPPSPTNFEEQRIIAAIQASQNGANPAAEEQGHRMLGQWYLNHGDQQRGMNEHGKALYWKNGAR